LFGHFGLGDDPGNIFREYFPKKEIYITVMKKFIYSLLVLIVSLGLPNARAEETSKVRIEFVHPERFTDFQIQGRDENSSVPIFRNEVTSHLSGIVSKRFPGKTLTLKFTDIDLGGRLGNRPRFNDVRFNHQWGPPIRMAFDYTITDSKANVVIAGSKTLLEQDYLHQYINYPQSLKTSPVFYEEATLANWLRTLEPSGGRLARD
jgi:Protein of unknown function (DUF3016)